MVKSWHLIRAEAVKLFLISIALVSVLLFLIIETMRPVGQWIGVYLDAAKVSNLRVFSQSAR